MPDKYSSSAKNDKDNQATEGCDKHSAIEIGQHDNLSMPVNSDGYDVEDLREEFNAIFQRHSKTLWELVDK